MLLFKINVIFSLFIDWIYQLISLSVFRDFAKNLRKTFGKKGREKLRAYWK